MNITAEYYLIFWLWPNCPCYTSNRKIVQNGSRHFSNPSTTIPTPCSHLFASVSWIFTSLNSWSLLPGLASYTSTLDDWSWIPMGTHWTALIWHLPQPLTWYLCPVYLGKYLPRWKLGFVSHIVLNLQISQEFIYSGSHQVHTWFILKLSSLATQHKMCSGRYAVGT